LTPCSVNLIVVMKVAMETFLSLGAVGRGTCNQTHLTECCFAEDRRSRIGRLEPTNPVQADFAKNLSDLPN
jgi:hypothetical protein